MNALVRMFDHLLTINKIKTQVFIEYRMAGTLFTEYKVKEVPNRDHPNEDDFVYWAYAYSFFERDYVEVEQQRIYIGERKNKSKVFYPKARLMTMQKIKEEFPDKDILIRNMESAKANTAIHCKAGNFLIYDPENDVILP